MDVVTVSPKYQIVIPAAIRRQMAVRPGAKLAMMERGGVIEMVLLSRKALQFGSIPGLDTKNYRDRRDRV